MDIDVAYGSDTISLRIPDSMSTDEYAPDPGEALYSIEQFEAQIREHGGSDWLESDDLLFVLNDGHRNTPTPLILSWLNRIWPGILDKSRFLIATGTHQPPTDAHYDKIFGDLRERLCERVEYHVATDTAAHESIGVDRFGGDVMLDRRFVEAKRVIAINSVEPHYFAGFTGGRKSLFPGLANLGTIERNHNLANSLACRPMRLDGNPMSEHLDELLGLADTDKLFAIQTISISPTEVVAVTAGEIREAFRRATERAVPVFSRKATAPYDLLIAELRPPLDGNLYQIQKAIENTQMAVVDGGDAVLVSPCRDGVGSAHFFELADHWDATSNKPRDGKLLFGSHKLSRVIDMQRRIGVWVWSELAGTDVEKVYYKPLGDLQEMIDSLAQRRPGARVAVVHDAGNMVLTTE